MKKLFVILFLTMGIHLNAQVYDPVSWSTSVERISENEYDLIATATIEEGWHLYSQNVPEGGPIATTFTFETVYGMEMEGETKEGKGHQVYDEVFEMDITYFENKAVFEQRIRLTKAHGNIINGTVEFMVCDNANCLPPKEESLIFKLN
ncbi:protein-disulfide reductase DsbD domain-containing protein [Galbibacter mesophilus]|uniref:protein-disulfide reductase DsbD domain-containing protein n=1 Tax=Galbibacter mesophilus TaxID=379069 RepID=UPI00191D4D74|nr:protein-disulfide reductase DsbD domain-containing protein [Galbibacter mesophilus]MCM5662661.1 protein-disulfide reductase DsbD N-terminal domain-containing protein [Galbibacter mesophilus]